MIRALSRSASGGTAVEIERHGDLASGLAALEEGAFDCILLDLSLPDSEGLEGVDRVIAAASSCPTVVLTGLDDPAIAVQAVAHGAQDYLVKGSATPELIERSVGYAIARFWTESRLVATERRLEAVVTREQIARDLHDTVIQRLFAAGMSLQAGVGLADDELRNRVRGAVEEIDDAIRELRQAIFGLHAHEVSAFEGEMHKVVESFHEPLGLAPTVTCETLPDLDDQARHDLLAAAREALSNIARHANATAVDVAVSVSGGFVILAVEHLGPVVMASTRKEEGTGRGLTNLAARAEEHGGEFDLRLAADSSKLRFTVRTS